MPKTTQPAKHNAAVNKKNISGQPFSPDPVAANDITVEGHLLSKTLFLEELDALYGAEKYQEFILPLLKRSASSLKLQSVLAGHLYETYDHLQRLEQAYIRLGQRSEGKRNEAILGIARQCEHVIGETQGGTPTRDAGLILAARQLESYEISAYDSLAQLARTLEYDDIADELEMTLNEEKDVDDLLTTLADNYIHPEACRE